MLNISSNDIKMSLSAILQPNNIYDLYARSFNGVQFVGPQAYFPGNIIAGGFISPRNPLTTVTSSSTLTASEIIDGVVIVTGAAGYITTLPTAGDIIAAIPHCQIGQQFECDFINTGAGGTNIWYINSSAGSTTNFQIGSPLLVLPGQSVHCKFILTALTNIANAVQVYSNFNKPTLPTYQATNMANGATNPTAAQFIGGIFSRSLSAGDALTGTLPSAAALTSYLGSAVVGNTFEVNYYLDISDLSGADGWSITLTPGAGTTFYDGSSTLVINELQYFGPDNNDPGAYFNVSISLRYWFNTTSSCVIFYTVSGQLFLAPVPAV